MADDPKKFSVFRIERAPGHNSGPPRLLKEKIAVAILAGLVVVGGVRSAWQDRGVVRGASSPLEIEAQTGTWNLCNAISQYSRNQRISGRSGIGSLPPSTPQTPALPPGRDGITVPRDAWQEPAWRALGFEILGPHHFSYAWTQNKNGGVIRAVGDPDGDGALSVAERAVTLREDGGVYCGDQSVGGDAL